MTTATIGEQETQANQEFPATQWDSLLALIEERQVVPVIGREIVQIVDPEDGQEKTLVRWLSSKLTQKLGKVPLPHGLADEVAGLTLDQYVSGYVRNGGRARVVYSCINNLLKENTFEPSETLKKLARIREFGLFITTNFDPLLQTALEEVRHDATDVIVYRPNQVNDLPCPKEELQRTTLYHLLGQTSGIPRSFAVCEEDVLEWMASLQSDTFTPELLAEELKNSQLLLLGLQCNDWLARFFIRMAKRRRLSERRDFGEVLADNRSTRDGDLCDFLSAFSRDTLIFSKVGGAKEFVDELYDRYNTTRPISPEVMAMASRPNTSGPIRFLPPEKEMPPSAVFISYSRDDIEAVKRLKARLDGSNLPSWFDMKELKSGDVYEQKIQNNIKACSYFVPVMSSSTASRDEAFFRREWNWASERMNGMAEGALFIFPVVIDESANFQASRPPQKFLASNLTEAPNGELPDAFINRLVELLHQPA